MVVKIKLVNKGCKHNPLWWFIVQKPQMKLTGRYIEKIGYWRPRNRKTYDRSISLNIPKVKYWLGNGAQPTKPVKRLLTEFDLWPKVPPPQGSKYAYEKPKKVYSEHSMNILLKTFKMDRDTPIKQRIQDEIAKLKTLNSFERDMLGSYNIDKMQTTDIDTDENNVIERNIKFNELKRRFDNHKKYSLDVMNANDYKFNNYLRKMNKLAMNKFGGLDIDGYTDYLNNLMEFKKIDKDLILDKDPHLNDKLHIDYTGKEQKGPRTGKPMNHSYNFEDITTIQNKVRRLAKMKETLIEILRDEIEERNRYEVSHKIGDEDRLKLNLYKQTKDKSGFSEDTEALYQVTKSHKEMNAFESNHVDALKASPEYGTPSNTMEMMIPTDEIQNMTQEEYDARVLNDEDNFDENRPFFENENEFLEKYDEVDEEITLTIVEYLHLNPHLFRKIRFLQRGNEALNEETLPEMAKLRALQKRVEEKVLKESLTSVPIWVENTDDNFKREYISRGNSFLKKYNAYELTPDPEGEFETINPTYDREEEEDLPVYDGTHNYVTPEEVDRISTATKILVEGYKRVQQGKKNVSLSDILKVLNIRQEEPWEIEQEEFTPYDTENTYNKSEIVTDSGLKVPGFTETNQMFNDKRNEVIKKSVAEEMKRMEESEGEGEGDYEQEEEEDQNPRDKARAIEDKVYRQLNTEGMEYLNSIAGRYPLGYRHYENYEVYVLKFPERSLQDYIDDMNREVTFEEYFDLSLTTLRFLVRSNAKIRMEVIDLTDGHPERIEWILNSNEIKERMRDEFNLKLRQYYAIKDTFKLVDALEEFMEMGFYGDISKYPENANHRINPY